MIAVEMLRSTGKTVRLKLIRYVRGFKYEQLQQAIANSQNSLGLTLAKTQAPTASHPQEPPVPQQQHQMISSDSVVSGVAANSVHISKEKQLLVCLEGK